ncbi:MAG: nuclear transport factor 2 family protein [Thermoleophilaceae bacterium]
MSRANVELVERAYRALNRHDLDGFMELCAADVEYVNPPGAADPGVRRGQREFRAALQSLLDSFEDYRAEPQRMVEAGSAVVAIERSSGRGRTSGASFEVVHAHVFTIEEGKIVRFEWFPEPEEALAAGGPAE